MNIICKWMGHKVYLVDQKQLDGLSNFGERRYNHVLTCGRCGAKWNEVSVETIYFRKVASNEETNQ